jgi:hypothetical protein
MEGFYVTITKGAKSASLAAGPFATYEEAHEKVNVVRLHILSIRTYALQGAHLWDFGTKLQLAKRGKALPVGKLNEKLGFVPTVPAT